jgi:hypothetical protein
VCVRACVRAKIFTAFEPHVEKRNIVFVLLCVVLIFL